MGAIASLFGGGKKESAPPPVQAPEVRPAEEGGGSNSAKKLARAALIETSPMGDLSPVSTGRKKILGN